MHEIGVLMEIVKTVERFAYQHEVTKIDALVLQIGELSSMIPKYLQTLYPAVIEDTILAGSTLQIEILKANGRCRSCEKVFPLTENKGICPVCSSEKVELLSGKEFYIKEISCC